MSQWIDSYKNGVPPRQIVVTGFHGIWEAHQNNYFHSILNAADIWIPDGIAPVFIARLMGVSNMVRTPGAELMHSFFNKANQSGYRSFFYGDTDKTLAGLSAKLSTQYPGHKIAGTFSPPFRNLTASEEAKALQMINDARPDVLWVGLGLPKQERWIFERKKQLKVPIAIGVGAAFAFISGDVQRVPRVIGNHGLEWLWRFMKEPKKLWRRDLIDGPQFLWHVFLELAGLKKPK